MQGRQLTSGTKGTGTAFSYSYNSDGLRTQKVVGNTTYDYYWNGSQLAMMTITSGTNVTTLKFYYDAQGVPFYLDYNGTGYFYVTNLQGDVVGIANSNGVVGYYEYDAWGRIVAMDAASSMEYSALTYNPLRYRGYIYDTETGFYYLQSRYYDPAIRRFINADSYASTGTGFLGYNMFAYCENNPVRLIDPTGCIAIGVLELATAGMFILGLLGLVVAEPTVKESAAKGLTDLLDKISELVDELTIDAVVDTDIAESPEQEPEYYGAHVYGGKPWEKTTGPMTMDQATIWIYMTAASNQYGRGAAWGVYTAEEVDACALAVRIRNGQPIQHRNSGCYPHYHIKDYDFGRYKHFHIWYGEILP